MFSAKFDIRTGVFWIHLISEKTPLISLFDKKKYIFQVQSKEKGVFSNKQVFFEKQNTPRIFQLLSLQIKSQ